VSKQIPSYLKLVTDTIAEPSVEPNADRAAWENLCQAFEQSVGFRLQYDTETIAPEKMNLMWSAPVDPGVGNSLGHIRLFSCDRSAASGQEFVSLEQAAALALPLGNLWAELQSVRDALRHRETELAAEIPVTLDAAGDLGLSPQRIEAILRGGAEAIGCQAAALYLLDPATTELKLRASWGLPAKRLAEPARPLRGAIAELEALMGHAVVLNDSQLFDYWKVPESQFGACVCVPVSSASMPLGTLWFYARESREFGDTHTNLCEVVAGRLAADLERQVLVDEAVSARDQARHIEDAAEMQMAQLPAVTPLMDGWKIAARTHHYEGLGGTFYDWFALRDQGLAVIAGDSYPPGMSAALTASTLRGAARALAPDCCSPAEVLRKANTVLWTGSTGNAAAGMMQIVLHPNSGEVMLAAGGPLRVLHLSAERRRALHNPSLALGIQDPFSIQEHRVRLAAGDLLLVYGTSFLGFGGLEEKAPAGPATVTAERLLGELDSELAASLCPCLDGTAAELLEIAEEILQTYGGSHGGDRLLVALHYQGQR